MIERWYRNGLMCCMREGVFGCPCGYVRLPKSFLDYELSKLRKELEGMVFIHGGITHLGRLKEVGDDPSIWVGFDMAHAGDIVYDDRKNPHPIRTFKECKEETNWLAEQIETVFLKSKIQGE